MLRELDIHNNEDIRLLERICRESGSAAARRDAAYLRKAIWQLKEKPERLWCEILGEKGFYLATRGSGHVRLIEIAVKEGEKGNGYGKMLLYRLLRRMETNGIKSLTFRTTINESAADFWLHMGAKITGLKDDDYEMKITLK